MLTKETYIYKTVHRKLISSGSRSDINKYTDLHEHVKVNMTFRKLHKAHVSF